MLTGKLKKLRILPLFRSEKRNRVVVLIDWENLRHNIELPERFSMMDSFDQLLRQISQELGEIVDVFVFAPPHSAMVWGEDFQKLGFFIIFCPKVKDKEGKERDSTDDVLTEFGKKAINQIPDLTHLCLGSGDKDFSPLVREAIRKGLKIAVIAGNLRSLSSNLIKLASKKPGGEKLIYILHQ